MFFARDFQTLNANPRADDRGGGEGVAGLEFAARRCACESRGGAGAAGRAVEASRRHDIGVEEGAVSERVGEERVGDAADGFYFGMLGLHGFARGMKDGFRDGGDFARGLRTEFDAEVARVDDDEEDASEGDVNIDGAESGDIEGEVEGVREGAVYAEFHAEAFSVFCVCGDGDDADGGLKEEFCFAFLDFDVSGF